jgi:uncharacterized protein with ACT and thioredoxin-like domain
MYFVSVAQKVLGAAGGIVTAIWSIRHHDGTTWFICRSVHDKKDIMSSSKSSSSLTKFTIMSSLQLVYGPSVHQIPTLTMGYTRYLILTY